MANSIQSTLTFDIKQDGESANIIAEGSHKRGSRKVSYVYARDSEQLTVAAFYYLGGELRNESFKSQSWDVSDGCVDYNGQDIRQFVRDNFHADPEITLTDEFESMVDI